ncbi:MAG: metallophosphoesterase [Desulfuromonas sp.]|nr:metallophosphoesterase [Desulfuromonas sp.]
MLTACGSDSNNDKLYNEFNTDSSTRNLIVIVSDFHLGADLDYAEINANLPALENFLQQIRTSRNVKELVIAGDLLDEWFVPASVDTYKGKDQADFVDRIAATNAGVFEVLNQIITDGIILVTYTPGNHDLTIEAENVERILPGINQARDAEDAAFGLGTYSPADYPTIAIEHGHRYNYFCAPDQFSNQVVALGTILPPGYFFTRIAAEHVLQKKTGDIISENIIPLVTPNSAGGESQTGLYAYYKIWKFALEMFPINNTFIEDMIVTNVDGFTDSFSVNDLLPSQDEDGGLIKVYLYAGAQDRWTERCELNNIPVAIPVVEAIAGAISNDLTDSMAITQYFENPNSDKKLVVFGHTHEPKIIPSKNLAGGKTLYANSGTWIDHNPDKTTMNFIVITPQTDAADSETAVALYNFENEVITKMDEDSVRI